MNKINENDIDIKYFQNKLMLYPKNYNMFNTEIYDGNHYVKESNNYYKLSTGNYPIEYFDKIDTKIFLDRINEYVDYIKDELLNDDNYNEMEIDDYIRDLESFSSDLQAKLDFENMNADEKKEYLAEIAKICNMD